MITMLSASKGAQNHRATRKRCRQLQTLSESGLVAAETGKAVGEEGHERILMMGTLLQETTSEMDFWCCRCSNCFHMYALTYDLLHVYKCRYIYIYGMLYLLQEAYGNRRFKHFQNTSCCTVCLEVWSSCWLRLCTDLLFWCFGVWHPSNPCWLGRPWKPVL